MKVLSGRHLKQKCIKCLGLYIQVKVYKIRKLNLNSMSYPISKFKFKKIKKHTEKTLFLNIIDFEQNNQTKRKL